MAHDIDPAGARLGASRAAALEPSARGVDPAADPSNFSIVLGGPLFQALRRAHFMGEGLELLRRRVVAIAAIAWVPLFVLTLIQGSAFGGPAAVPFITDVEVHVRFLVALPLLIVAELIVHLRLRPIANEFLVAGLVRPEDSPRFEHAVASAMRLRNSMLAELAMIALVYGLGVNVIWREVAALDVSTWYAAGSAQDRRFTWAGIWYVYVSVPIFQFLLLRWYFRLVVWMRFLWQVSRLNLRISAMHADRMGGLGFLAGTVFAFVPLAMAHGAVVSGTIANRIFHLHTQLTDAQVEIAIVVAFLLVIVFLPLTFFAAQVAQAKRVAARTYGRVAQKYVAEFESKWLPDGRPASESALGSGDIQSLADLANSMETIRSTRPVPITRQAIATLALATLLPIAPLLLTIIPAEELGKHLLKLLM